jgi:hypothetical protein
VGRDAVRLAEEARRQGIAHLDYLGELLKAECHERETRRAARRIKETGFPLVKTLEGRIDSLKILLFWGRCLKLNLTRRLGRSNNDEASDESNTTT